ncbi:MAG: hypothetical protein ACTTI6_10825 [Treponema sp.]|uniref:hypothetical protein n=1 Tax=Treponema sp. TaxID=166 RepID=UPI003FA33CAB
MKKILGIMVAVLTVHAAAFAIEIEAALAETAEQFSKTIKTGSTIAIIGISSDTEDMSDFMLDELTVNFVRLRKLKVADRANLAAIKKEMNFQLSGEVGDESIQQIGAMAGAQTVIRGNLKPFGESYLLVIHALNVTTAAVEDIYRAKVDASETVVLLLSAGAKKGSKKVLRADRYHGGQLAGLGFGNLLFGTGAYIAGNYVDGAILTAWHAANLGMFIGGIADLSSGGSDAGLAFLSLGCISGAARIIYGFVRPKYYVKRNKNQSMGAADILNGLNFAVAPLENGKTAVSLGYSLSLD